MAHSMTHDGAMFLSMVDAIRPFAEMLGRVTIPDSDREWFESRLDSLASTAERLSVSLRKQIASLEESAAMVSDVVGLGCRSPEMRVSAENLALFFGDVSDFASAMSRLAEAIDSAIQMASKATIDVGRLIAARDAASMAARRASDSVAATRRVHEEVVSVFKAFDAVGFDSSSAEFAIDNWRAMNHEMSDLRARARETGQTVSWGEPLLDD